MQKPRNHVTRALEASRLPEAAAQLPILDRHTLVRLATQFPPRCRGRDEAERDHDRYAGKVELVQELIAVAEQASPDDDQEQDVLLDGERAR